MKVAGKKTITIAAVLLCGIIIAGVIFLIFNNTDKSAPIKEITSVETLTLRLSGMRITEEYEIIANGDRAEISHYYITYGGEEKRELQNSVQCDTQDVVDKLNECKAGKWNGFYGKHPKGVLDGTMFNLTASVNGGTKLTAKGSQNFPKNFHTFEQWLQELTYKEK